MKLPPSTALSRIVFLQSLVALILYCVTLACSYWLVKDFKMPMEPLKGVTGDASIQMGVLSGCSYVEVPRLHSPPIIVSDDCSIDPDSAPGWQRTAATISIIGLSTAVLSFFSSGAFICIRRVAGKLKLRMWIIGNDFITCAAITTVVVMNTLNKFGYPVRPPPNEFLVDFDFSWGYFLAIVSAALYAIQTFLHIIDYIWSSEYGGFVQESPIKLKIPE